jgi:ribulose-5-phosphate 4-epimerase/fuculose-1-phosphate aldolase
MFSMSKPPLAHPRLIANEISNFAGVVLASDEGKNIARTLGCKRAALLGTHGLLTVGQSIEETVAMFVLLDKCCEVQLAADASSAGSGKPLVKIGNMEARATYEAIGTHASGYCKLYRPRIEGVANNVQFRASHSSR